MGSPIWVPYDITLGLYLGLHGTLPSLELHVSLHGTLVNLELCLGAHSPLLSLGLRLGPQGILVSLRPNLSLHRPPFLGTFPYLGLGQFHLPDQALFFLSLSLNTNLD